MVDCQNKRTLQELNLLDDFLFGSVACYPKIGEAVSRHILEIILQKKLGKTTIIPQKVYYGSNTTLHGTRLDVYVEEDCSDSDIIKNAVIYDLEPENKDDKLSINSLPKRVLYYHS